MRKGEISSALTSKLVEFARAAAKQEFSKCNQVSRTRRHGGPVAN